MSKARAGLVGTGNPDIPPEEKPEVVAAARSMVAAAQSVSTPSGSILVTSRQREEAPFNIRLDHVTEIQGRRTDDGFCFWYVPKDLVSRLCRHYFAVTGRIIIPEGTVDG